jgi:hypothetical protein
MTIYVTLKDILLADQMNQIGLVKKTLANPVDKLLGNNSVSQWHKKCLVET